VIICERIKGVFHLKRWERNGGGRWLLKDVASVSCVCCGTLWKAVA